LFDLLFDAHRTPPLVNDKTLDTIPVLAMSIQREHRESRHVEDAAGCHVDSRAVALTKNSHRK
ncbi:MAG: hypothetical protein SPK12_08005, partial [Collinsella sp.]|nr:hypothetical protein [Collinsella sp.]